ncbi:MAG: hypothetical protein Q4G39_09835 [Brachymonas sp.]|nr:hypothetical protein [Brachymonas sp.]
MPAKKCVVELVDAAGQPVADMAVKISGCDELKTSPAGTALFLVEESPAVVLVAGKEAFKADLAALPERLKLTQDGGGWKA